jgi:ribonuclease-3
MISEERNEELKKCQKKLGHHFKNINLLNQALTHKSFVNENERKFKDNERLEFLGDSVLDLIIGEYALKKFTTHMEGDLSKIRAALVNESNLSKIARFLGLGAYIQLGKGELLAGGSDKNSILANTFEALVAALYLDEGINKTASVTLPFFKSDLHHLANTSSYRDFKSELQEYAQAKKIPIPSYKVQKETGPDHNKIFEVTVSVNGQFVGQGKGKTKKEGEQKAANEALKKLKVKT